MTNKAQTLPQAEPATQTSPDTKPEPKPKGWVRWGGIAVFLSIVGLVVGAFYIGLGSFVKSQMESYASQAWGAKVEIADIDLALSPLRFSVKGVALTDPEKPLENLVAIKALTAELDLYQLVVGRTVINEVQFLGLVLHQPRQSSGAIAIEQSADVDADEDSGFSMPDIGVPDTDAILARESLTTVTQAKKIETLIETAKKDWESLQDDLPSQQDLDGYQSRFNALKEGDLTDIKLWKQKQKDLATLKEEIAAQKTSVDASKALFERIKNLKAEIAALKDLPKQDYDRLAKQYDLSENGLSNITYLLFGPTLQGWLDMGADWYHKAEPYLAMFESEDEVVVKRARGVNVAFAEYDPQPDFIIKHIAGDAVIDFGHVLVNVSQITIDQPVTNMPILFDIKATPTAVLNEDNQKVDNNILRIVGKSNTIDTENPHHFADIYWPNAQLTNWRVSGDDALPVSIKKGNVGVIGRLDVTKNGTLNGQFDATFNPVSLDANGSNSDMVANYIAPILNGVDHFKMQSTMTGEWDSPNVDIRSDLDGIIADGFKKQLKKEMDAGKKKLKKKLNALLAGKTGELTKALNNLLGNEKDTAVKSEHIDALLAGDLSSVKALAEQKLADAKRKAEEKVKAKIAKEKADAKRKLDAKKAEAQRKVDAKKAEAQRKVDAEKAAAKRKLDAEKAKAKKKADDKLKKEAKNLLKKLSF